MRTSTHAPYRLLRRPLDDRMVAGVCGGVARYFDIDPTLVRVGFAVLALATWGAALVAYPVMWVLMPSSAPVPPVNHVPVAPVNGDVGPERPPAGAPE